MTPRLTQPRITHMQVLRQERRPLVALAGLAFVMRLCLLILASALTPQAANAAGLSSLCQPSVLEQGQPSSHDPLVCQCGPVCAHGCALGPCLAASHDIEGHPAPSAAPVGDTRHAPLPLPGRERTRAIRAPPSVLT